MDKSQHILVCKDEFEGNGEHLIKIPFRFDPKCNIRELEPHLWTIETNGKIYRLIASGTINWDAQIQKSLISPSYGLLEECQVIEFSHVGETQALVVGIYPEKYSPPNAEIWLKKFL